MCLEKRKRIVKENSQDQGKSVGEKGRGKEEKAEEREVRGASAIYRRLLTPNHGT